MTTISLVTGSARGLGLAVARRFRERGDRVHVVWRSSESQAEQLVQEFGADCVHRADLAEPGASQALMDAVLSAEGQLDSVVHAVGDYACGPLAESSLSQLQQMWSSNVVSAFAIAEAAREHLRTAQARSGGSLLFFGCAGLEGMRARKQTAMYAASKSALVVLMRSMALEEAPFGVRVNMISPGIVPHEHASADTQSVALQERIPMGRVGELQEIAAAADWLTSSQSSYTTGANLSVAGGWML